MLRNYLVGVIQMDTRDNYEENMEESADAGESGTTDRKQIKETGKRCKAGGISGGIQLYWQ